MSIQKIAASYLSAAQETNVGLATLNVDFSLFKVEAPAEFRAIGNELAKSRKQVAEEGDHHVTARKLGALFQHSLPSAPHLIKAYGKRATEIMSCPQVNPKPTSTGSIFADHMGVDATSLWAAATSGGAAIAVHLLACMLARVWSSSEATSIWVELVECRKRELAEVDETDPMYHDNRHLSKLSVTREQLSEWDASARSWLQAADEVMARKHKQLMLIINNLAIPVNMKPTLFQSVLHAWKKAMELVNDLVSGQPQSVKDGSVLLGLSSWHIYPDMLVLKDSPVPVNQKDDLVDPAGILTIGLHLERGGSCDGIFWSLSLGHLRYYGGPVHAERSLNITKNRVAASNLMLVAFGCITKSWELLDRDTAQIILRLWDNISEYAHDYSHGTLFWLGHLSEALEQLFSDDQLTRQECEQLIRLGKTRCPNFLGTNMNIPTMFKLSQLETLLSLVMPLEARIQLLRDYVGELDEQSPKLYIIRYKVGHILDANGKECQDAFEYTTARPLPRLSLKRDQEGKQISEMRHVRWLDPAAIVDLEESKSEGSESALSAESVSSSSAEHPVTGRRNYIASFDEDILTINTSSMVTKDTPMGDLLRWSDPPEMFLPYSRTYTGEPRIDLYRVAGDINTIALLSAEIATKVPNRMQRSPHKISLALLDKNIQQKKICPKRTLRYLRSFINDPTRSEFLLSMRALATLKEVYKMLPGATVELRATSVALPRMAWVHHTEYTTTPSDPLHKFCRLTMTRRHTFSCICIFESGTFNLSPDNFRSVIAIAAGDSIYISAALLCDPYETPQPHEVRRIKGAIGKPGMALLIPPQKPLVREQEWKLINHRPFDGRLEDSFQATSLHLWFTGYTLPIDIMVYGSRDTEIYFLESAVSIHDKGIWVADVDILAQLSKGSILRIPSIPHGRDNESCSKSNFTLIDHPMFSTIDDWDEILDSPDYVGMVRSQGNWLGRLAATVLSLQLRHKVVVLSSHLCWNCVATAWSATEERPEDTGLLRAMAKEKVIIIC